METVWGKYIIDVLVILLEFLGWYPLELHFLLGELLNIFY